MSNTITYGRIIGIFSFGIFLESTWTKILQSQGDMKTPMIAQIVGALTNIVLDPILIFGMFGIKPMGVAGGGCCNCHRSVARRRHNWY